jgi:hypothetical protein
VISQETYEFPQCMKTQLAVSQWRITELTDLPAVPAGRLDHPFIAPDSPQVTAHFVIPVDRTTRISQVLQQWIDLSATSTGGRWRIVESLACSQKTLFNGESQALLTYAYKDRQVMLLIQPETILTMLKKLCVEALNSSSRTHQELARPLLTHLKVSKYTLDKDVIEYTLTS